MRVGFTGTRSGMLEPQRAALWQLLIDLQPTEFHHGACEGADADAVLCVRHAIPIARVTAWPGVYPDGSKKHQSAVALRNSHRVEPDQGHRARNTAIVDNCDVLIAAPVMRPCPKRSGTAMTMNIAEAAGRRTVTVWPDGAVTDPAPTAPRP